ncbi:hypothetical protein lbkm_2834 [Lachnospiraceae bacterium KM106-2]|nr:hypothetical protein lbkm_2834 [Lachnospiraceae bacterium KM106-2]
MLNLLVFRERVKSVYQKYQQYIKPLAKFIMSLVIFLLINTRMGFDSRLGSLPIVILLSVLCAFTPSSILVLLASLITVAQVYAVSQFLAIIALLILLILYLVFIRFTPGQGIVVLAVPIMYCLKIPAVVPLLMGIVATPLAIIPVSCGTIAYYLFRTLKDATTIATSKSVDDVLALYKTVIENLINNKALILALVSFAVIIIVVYVMKSFTMDHAFELAIITGGVANILIVLIGDFVFNATNQIILMIIGTIISVAIVYVIQFFRLTLEYTAVERVQFEDDEYYYYVKAVPKVKVTTPEMSVKRYTTPQHVKVNETTEENEIDEFSDTQTNINLEDIRRD